MSAVLFTNEADELTKEILAFPDMIAPAASFVLLFINDIALFKKENLVLLLV
jgi:hypothetical protein